MLSSLTFVIIFWVGSRNGRELASPHISL